MFYKFRCAVARFMYGRNGMDQMNQALLRGYLVIVTRSIVLSRIFDLLITVMAVYLLFRMFSKNLPKRREENQKFMSWVWKTRNSAAGAKARRADKEHKYFTCKCGRVPCAGGKGKNRHHLPQMRCEDRSENLTNKSSPEDVSSGCFFVLL